MKILEYLIAFVAVFFVGAMSMYAGGVFFGLIVTAVGVIAVFSVLDDPQH